MSKPINAAVVNAFIEGTKNVLGTMCQTNPVIGKPSLKSNSSLFGDVTGAISLTGENNGLVVLSFSKEAACTIVSRMLYEEKSDIDDDVMDAVGEMTNMITGDSRKRLSENGMNYEAGIPTVVSGENHKISAMVSDDAATVVIPFKTDKDEAFNVEFTFEPK